MTSKSELIERLKDMKAVEIKARDNYIADIATFKNFKITESISLIKKDEDKHIEILISLLDMLERNK